MAARVMDSFIVLVVVSFLTAAFAVAVLAAIHFIMLEPIPNWAFFGCLRIGLVVGILASIITFLFYPED